MDPKKIGNFGERIACCYLKGKGYKILAKNYSKNWSAAKKGEVDIITKKGGIISFVEVKTIRQDFGQQETLPPRREGFLPEEKVNFQKQRKLINLAQSWLSENRISLESKWQIDIIAIRVDLNTKKAKIKHFQNAVY
jgi:putative endonuclease